MSKQSSREFKTPPVAETQDAVAKRAFKAGEGSRAIWLKAHTAALEALRARREVHARVAELARDQLFRRRYRDGMLAKILRAAMAGTKADKGNIQLVEPASGRLLLRIHEGFQAPFLDYFQSVEPGHAACGAAFQRGQRVIVGDVTNSEVFPAGPSLEVVLDAGVRAVQSTPLLGSNGRLLGMLSTHHAVPFWQTPQSLQVIDHYANWASSLIEWEQDAAGAASPFQYAQSAEP